MEEEESVSFFTRNPQVPRCETYLETLGVIPFINLRTKSKIKTEFKWPDGFDKHSHSLSAFGKSFRIKTPRYFAAL